MATNPLFEGILSGVEDVAAAIRQKQASQQEDIRRRQRGNISDLSRIASMRDVDPKSRTEAFKLIQKLEQEPTTDVSGFTPMFLRKEEKPGQVKVSIGEELGTFLGIDPETKVTPSQLSTMISSARNFGLREKESKAAEKRRLAEDVMKASERKRKERLASEKLKREMAKDNPDAKRLKQLLSIRASFKNDLITGDPDLLDRVNREIKELTRKMFSPQDPVNQLIDEELGMVERGEVAQEPGAMPPTPFMNRERSAATQDNDMQLLQDNLNKILESLNGGQ